MKKHEQPCTKICSEADRDLSDCQKSLPKEKNKGKEVEIQSESNCQQMLCINDGCGVIVPKVAVDMIQSGDCYFNVILYFFNN